MVATNPDNLQKVEESLKGRPGVKILVVGEAGEERKGGGGNVVTYHEVSNTPAGAILPPLAHPDNMFILPFSSGRQLTNNNKYQEYPFMHLLLEMHQKPHTKFRYIVSSKGCA